MKTRHLPLLLLLALFVPWRATAQETVTIGTGNSYGYLPAYTAFNNTLSQQLYTDDEIGGAGTISSIAFKSYSGNGVLNIKLYMENTYKTSFASTTDWVDTSVDHLVFEGDVTFTTGSWTTITLNTPFVYDGTNLAVIVDANRSSNIYYLYGSVFTSTTNCSISAYSGNVDYDATNPSSYTANYRYRYKNQIQLGITRDVTSCPKPTNLAFSNLSSNSVDLNWTENGGAISWVVEYGTTYDFTNATSSVVDSNPASLIDLTPETTYYVHVKANCDQSLWSKVMTFTTDPTCLVPIDFNASNITDSEATLSWTPRGSENDWVLEYCTNSSFTDATTVEVSTSPDTTLSGLNANTKYYARVKADCGSGDQSHWSSTMNFTTLCAPITAPWMEDFEGFDTDAVPECWDNTPSTSTSSPKYIWGVNSCNGNNVLRMANCTVNTGTALINSQPITLPASGDYKLYFKYSHRADCGPFWVKVKPVDGSTFTDLFYYTATTTDLDCNDPGMFIDAAPISLADYAGQTIIIQFYSDANYGQGAIFLDDVNISSCRIPTALAASNVTATGVTLSWTAGEESDWVLQYATNATFTEGLMEVTEGFTRNGNVVSYSFTNLTNEQTYYARVKANCGGEESLWSHTLSFIPSAFVTIGTGTETTGTSPLYGYYKMSYDQMIYTAEQLNLEASQITKIGFNAASANTVDRTVTIYMGHTTKNYFSNYSDFVSINGLTQVYSGTWSITAGWNVFDLTTPFDYDGSSNLVIAIFSTASSKISSSFYYSQINNAQVIYAYSDTYSPDPSVYENNWSNYSGSRNYNFSLPNFRLMAETSSTPIPCNLTANTDMHHQATLTWDPPTNAMPINYSCQYKVEGGEWSEEVTTSDLTITYTGLTADVNYIFRVRANYSVGQSNFLQITFKPSATQTITIGSETSVTSSMSLPVNMFYNYSLTQQIFTAQEIGMAGTIRSISFYYKENTYFRMADVKVFMKVINKDSFSSVTDMVAVTDSDKVWEGVFTAPSPYWDNSGWLTIDLDTPFVYDGTSNLLVCCYDPTDGSAGGLSFRTTATTDNHNRAITYYSNTDIPSLDDVSTFTDHKEISAFRTDIQLEILPSQTFEMPIVLSAGWNWWAPMMQITAEQLRSAISGIAIYSKESENNEVADDVSLEPGRMYKLQTDDAIENVSVMGILTTPVNGISAGTNWIGYTGETAVIATALNTFDITPSYGDKIISQDGGFAIYNGTAWEGTLTSLEQGEGYVYVRLSTE